MPFSPLSEAVYLCLRTLPPPQTLVVLGSALPVSIIPDADIEKENKYAVMMYRALFKLQCCRDLGEYAS